MKLKELYYLLAVSIVATTFVMLPQCKANWTHLYSDTEVVGEEAIGGHFGQGDGESRWESKIYDGHSETANANGCSISANMFANELVLAWGISVKHDPTNTTPSIDAYSYYADVSPCYETEGLTVQWSIETSGTLTASGQLDDIEDDKYEDTCSADADASAFCDAAGGWGYAFVEVDVVSDYATSEENPLDEGSYYLGGYAVLDGTPDISTGNPPGGWTSNIIIDFEVSAYDTEEDVGAGSGSNQYTASTSMSVGADAIAEVDLVSGGPEEKSAYAYASGSLSGNTSVTVTMP